jgi:hypothetical protein
MSVKTHIGRLLARLDARDRAQLVLVGYETGLVGVTPVWSGGQASYQRFLKLTLSPPEGSHSNVWSHGRCPDRKPTYCQKTELVSL